MTKKHFTPFITPCHTLEMMDYPLYKQAQSLLHAYFFAGGTDDDGVRFAALPETWLDEGVYIDFNLDSIEAFLVNLEGCVLIETDNGLMRHYFIDDIAQGTLYDLAESFITNCMRDDEVLPHDAWKNWSLENAKEACYYFDNDLPALENTISSEDYKGLERVKTALSAAII